MHSQVMKLNALILLSASGKGLPARTKAQRHGCMKEAWARYRRGQRVTDCQYAKRLAAIRAQRWS